MASIRYNETEVVEYLTRFQKRPWSQREINILTKYYQETSPDVFSLRELAIRLRRSVRSCQRRAARLGITGYRPQTLVRRKSQSEWAKNWRQVHPDHKPALGIKFSEEAKERLSLASRKRWQDPNSYFNQPEYRQYLSDRFSKTVGLRRGYTKGSGGKRTDLGDHYFRSSWEANYARYLNFLQKAGDIFKWEYEPDVFWFEKIKRGTRSYTPDFKIWVTEKGEPHYEEIKGWYDKRSKTKMKRMRRYYPAVKVILIDEKAYAAISSQVRRLIPNWESKRQSLKYGR